METKVKRAKINNVIILDCSGSMSSIRREAITGVNETLAAIRSSQLRDIEQDNYVTLVVFCGCKMKRIYDLTPIAEAIDLTYEQYVPCCTTPLYDAIGTTLRSVREKLFGERTAVSVTIITDGYENSSTEFTGVTLKKLIDACKEEGWLFAYIGADHDVERVASELHIVNHMRFDKTSEGTGLMFHKNNYSRDRWVGNVAPMITDEELSDEDLAKSMKATSSGFFDDIPF